MQGLSEAIDLLRAGRRLVVLTGAGVSAESGVPTFRDALEGLWARYDPMLLATPEAFARDPALVSRWYDERRQRVLGCEPNPAHRALAAWQRACAARGDCFTLLTQNVDRLHQRAGSEDVVELHGSLLAWRCTASGRERDDLPLPLPHYPYASEAGGLYRPGVVWFGEALPPVALARAHADLTACDVVVSIGTSAVVQPAASFVAIARECGAATIEINRDATPLTGEVDVSVRGLAGEILPRLVRMLE